MKALILAGGLGTRLRPLTYTRPKHLLPIVNRPHIEHVLDLLRRHDIHEVVLLTSYLAGAFDEVVERAEASGTTVWVTREEEPLGTAGAIKNAQDLLAEGDDFVVFNGDILTDADIGGLVELHRARGADATILLTRVDDPSGFGVVPTDDDNRVLGFVEKPPPGEAPTDLVNAGVYVMAPAVLEEIPEGEVWSAERRLFPDLVAAGALLLGVPTLGYWKDIGTPAKYLDANLDALAGRFAPAAGLASSGIALGAGTRVDASARISSSCLGDEVVVGPGVTVERSVLLPKVSVGRRATLRDCVVGEGAAVAAEATIVAETIADGEERG